MSKKHLFYDAVYLVKNIQNNVLNYKRSIFASFKFEGFKDPIDDPGEKQNWSFFNEVHEKNPLLEAKLRKVLQLTAKVLNKGNCKQNYPTAIVIFRETTIVAIQSIFPDETITVDFLKLISKKFTLRQKLLYLDIFQMEFGRSIVIFQISYFKIAKIQNFMLKKTLIPKLSYLSVF